jgi:hypothetical protein
MSKEESIMIPLWKVVTFIHLSGLVLGVGAATVKIALVVRCYFDRDLVPVYVKVSRIITRFIVLGLVLLTLSGVVLLFIGAKLTPLLIVKLAAVAAVWGIGPFIDNAVEPKLVRLAPAPGEQAISEFLIVQKQHLTLEVIALLLFYIATIMGRMI